MPDIGQGPGWLPVLPDWLRVQLSSPEAAENLLVCVDNTTGVSIYVPVGSPDTFWWCIGRSGEVVLTDDLRLTGCDEHALDPQGIYTLLQFGTLLAPFSCWRGVSSIPAGRRLQIQRGTGVVPVRAAVPNSRPAEGRRRDSGQIETGVISEIDGKLRSGRESGSLIILFSGGVDSGLLAARAAALRFKDTTLVNLAFGPSDPESLLAEQMARSLGLRFVRVIAHELARVAGELLDRAVKLYRFPFADLSAVPTFALVRQVLDMFGDRPHVVLEGTGGDACFGLSAKARKWAKVHSLPKMVRGSLARELYARMGCAYGRGPAGVERLLRVLVRAGALPFPLSAIAQNPLWEVGFTVPPEVQRQAVYELHNNGCWREERHSTAQLIYADVSCVCGRVFSQKTRSLFGSWPTPSASISSKLVYPFLSDRMVHLGIETGRIVPESSRETKVVLKRALARHVPKELVYRRKSAFTGNVEEILRASVVKEALRAVVDNSSPLSGFIKTAFVQNVLDQLDHIIFPDQTNSFLWLLAFCNQWLKQACISRLDRSDCVRPRPPST